MQVQYDSYVIKKVNGFKFTEYTNDLMIGDCVHGCNGFTYVEREPKTTKVSNYYVLEHNGYTTMIAPTVRVKMNDGSYKTPDELVTDDVLYPKQVVQYVGYAQQPLYMTDVTTEDNSIMTNGLYLKGGE